MKLNVVLVSCLLLIFAANASSSGAQAQGSTSVNALVAPGRAIVAISETLDELAKAEPKIDRDWLLIEFMDFSGEAEVRISNYGGGPDQSGDVVIRSRPISAYRSEVIAGRAQPLTPLSDDDEYRYPGIATAEPVEVTGTQLFMFGSDLRAINIALDAVRSKYKVSPHLENMLVSYTNVTRTSSEDRSQSKQAYVVFAASRPEDSYTVYLEDGKADEVYLGIMQWNGSQL